MQRHGGSTENPVCRGTASLATAGSGQRRGGGTEVEEISVGQKAMHALDRQD